MSRLSIIRIKTRHISFKHFWSLNKYSLFMRALKIKQLLNISSSTMIRIKFLIIFKKYSDSFLFKTDWTNFSNSSSTLPAPLLYKRIKRLYDSTICNAVISSSFSKFLYLNMFDSFSIKSFNRKLLSVFDFKCTMLWIFSLFWLWLVWEDCFLRTKFCLLKFEKFIFVKFINEVDFFILFLASLNLIFINSLILSIIRV